VCEDKKPLEGDMWLTCTDEGPRGWCRARARVKVNDGEVLAGLEATILMV